MILDKENRNSNNMMCQKNRKKSAKGEIDFFFFLENAYE